MYSILFITFFYSLLHINYITMIRAITYNCQELKSSIHNIQALCSSYDLIFIQESWLFQFELSLLSQIDSEFEGFGKSAIDATSNIIRGRPYGGMAIPLRKKYRSKGVFKGGGGVQWVQPPPPQKKFFRFFFEK